jgi:hypothetical protein
VVDINTLKQVQAQQAQKQLLDGNLETNTVGGGGGNPVSQIKEKLGQELAAGLELGSELLALQGSVRRVSKSELRKLAQRVRRLSKQMEGLGTASKEAEAVVSHVRRENGVHMPRVTELLRGLGVVEKGNLGAPDFGRLKQVSTHARTHGSACTGGMRCACTSKVLS